MRKNNNNCSDTSHGDDNRHLTFAERISALAQRLDPTFCSPGLVPLRPLTLIQAPRATIDCSTDLPLLYAMPFQHHI